jgi:hypothetical protein
MENIELNINNYNYEELLNIYKLQDNINDLNNENFNKKIIENTLEKVRMNFPKEIYKFYNQCQKIIYTIYKAINDNVLIKDNNEINIFMKKIYSIDNFDKFTESDIIEKIVDKSMSAYNKGLQNLSLYNEKYPNVNKFVPGLNNHNNTNTITNTFPNSVTSGNLNPVKRITLNQNLNLNSCFRNNYYQSNPADFFYTFPIEIKNVLSLRLVSIEIPNSWYLFSHVQKNNIFQIEIKTNLSEDIFNIVVPDGNYDCETLQNFLNTNYFYESQLESNLKFLKFYIDSYSLKSRFEIIETGIKSKFTSFSFSLKFVEEINQNILNTLGWTLGFRLANYRDIKDFIQSEGLYDGGGDRYIYIALNDYQYNNNTLNTVCFDKSILNEEVIAKIPMINGKFSLIVLDDNPLTKIRKYTGPVNLSKIHIKILDKFGNIIDLNNMDYSLTLELEILYESFNFKNVSV